MKGSCYKIRGVRSKGAMLVQLWSFTFFVIMVYLSGFQFRDDDLYTSKMKVLGLALPIAGCLSDVFVGRYRIVRYSNWVLFFSLVALNLVLVLLTYTWHSWVFTTLLYVFSGLVIVGTAGAMANAVQLGIDQLVHASSSDIQSYLSWYVWNFSLANTVVPLTEGCFCKMFNKVTAFILLPFLCTMVIASDFTFNSFNSWLVKEPVLHNPLKLIFQVIRYAINNKHPRLRSAFTYWDDKPISRMDVGKVQYGGPFTNEQVEDVKTFFRFVAVTAVSTPLSILIFLMFHSYQVEMRSYQESNFISSCNGSSTKHYMSNCYQSTLVAYSQFAAILVLVPIFEFAIYPLLIKLTCFYRVGILHKLIIVTILVFVYYTCLLSLKVSALYAPDSRNATCFLSHKGELSYNELSEQQESVQFDYRWLVGTQIISSFIIYLSLVSAMELSCSQSPYSMKGILMGMVWLQIGASYLISELTVDGLNKPMKNAHVICGVWFYASLAGFTLVTLFIQALISKFYRFRRREEILSNDQMFAINYFNKYLPQSAPS